MTSLPQNPDVIIVGAGTSGLSAASALKQKGKKALVLEADDHVGGRCITDASCFSMPFDRGGSWLHSAEINPLSKLAETHGFKLHKKYWISESVIIAGEHLYKEEVADYITYMDYMWDTIVEAGSSETNASIDQILPPSKWKDTAKLFIAQMLGGDFDVISPMDMAAYDDSDGDWLVEGGLGNFVKHLHSGVSVMLNCPVTKIDHSGSKVRVSTPRGTVEASHVILTVSVGVLASENIEFVPALPNRKLQAISDLPNGLLNKVGIEFNPKWQEASEGFMLDYHSCDEEYCSVLFGFYGGNLATGFTAGRFGAHLENEGDGAATEFCMQALRDAFGNDITKHILKTSETAWLNNPLTLGSYSYLSPGCKGAREALAESVDSKLHFAGEATMPSEFATVHGAYMSGKQAAGKVMET